MVEKKVVVYKKSTRVIIFEVFQKNNTRPVPNVKQTLFFLSESNASVGIGKTTKLVVRAVLIQVHFSTSCSYSQKTKTKGKKYKESKMAEKQPKVAVIYYSMYGHIKTMAHLEKEGAEKAGCKVDIFCVPETLSKEVLAKMGEGINLQLYLDHVILWSSSTTMHIYVYFYLSFYRCNEQQQHQYSPGWL